jgi:hypothetical protein
MCDLYLGDTDSRATTPPTPVWLNPSIQSPTYVFESDGTSYPINVVLQNHDTGTGCAEALIELHWSDPTTSFLLTSGPGGNEIGTSTAPIAAKGTFDPDDASTTFTFNWVPTPAIAATNLGHVCLAAIASCTSADCVAPAPPGPTADIASPQVAIHNVHVNPPPMPMPPPKPGGPPPFWRPWPFFFGATNGGGVAGVTRLVARAYDPANEADRIHLIRLANLPAVRAAYGRCLKFGTPAEVHLALGTETVVVPHASKGVAPRLGSTGRVKPDFADHLVKRDWVKATGHAPAAKEFELIPRQIQQAGISVIPREDDGHIYAIEIGHELVVKGKPHVLLGGLTVLFAAACRPW